MKIKKILRNLGEKSFGIILGIIGGYLLVNILEYKFEKNDKSIN